MVGREVQQHGSMSTYSWRFGLWRAGLIGAIGVAATAGVAGAESRLNLPQIAREVRLSAETRVALDGVIETWAGDGEHGIAPGVGRLLLGDLPAEMREGCREMLADFEQMTKVNRDLSVRVLHAERVGEERTALVAFRCSVHIPDVTAYDERPAVMVLGKDASVLRLLALADDCRNCSDLYHVGYTQRFAGAAGYLAELKIEHTTDNPCCDGVDSHSGNELMLVTVPDGAVALMLDKDSDDMSADDSDPNGGGQTICKSEVLYERDGKGYVAAVTARTSCATDGKFEPPVKVNRFEWSAGEKRFLRRNGE